MQNVVECSCEYVGKCIYVKEEKLKEGERMKRKRKEAKEREGGRDRARVR